MSGAGRRLILLDRDGVVNRDEGGYVTRPEEWEALPGSLEAIASLHGAGFDIVIVSNQAGVGHGLYTHGDVAAVHDEMRQQVEAAGGRIAAVHYCPHRPDEGCGCRKPKAGLLRRVERETGRALTGVPFVGDKVSDVEAARAVGARPMLVLTGHGTAAAAALERDPCEVYADLAEAARALLGEARDEA